VPTSFKPMQRAGVASELPALLAELGVPVEPVFDGSGIDPKARSPDTKIPLDALGKLIHRASRQARTPHLGLLLGVRFTLEHHGLIGRLMRCAPTVRQALADFVSWQPGYSSGAIVYVARWGTSYAFGYGIHDRYSVGGREIYDCVGAISCRMIEELTGGKARPAEVHLSLTAVDTMPYQRLMKSKVLFGQANTCSILDSATLDFPVPTANAQERKRILDSARTLNPASPFSIRVRRVVRELLIAGEPFMDAAAERLLIHPRTLRRRLAEENLTFEALRDQVRLVVSRELLSLTDLSMGEISSAIAFSTQGAFTEAFRRWTGETPSAWRAQGAIDTA
jgi:AraC-like DNA-binding protein